MRLYPASACRSASPPLPGRAPPRAGARRRARISAQPSAHTAGRRHGDQWRPPGEAMLPSRRTPRAAGGTRPTPVRHMMASRPAAHQPRNYALPNPTWTPDTKRLYEELSQDQSWRRLPSYKESARSRQSMCPEADRTRLFTRNLDQDGIGFEYCIFFNEAEKRTLCVFQPGPYLEGPPGCAHGGCIATIIDATVGVGIVHSCGPAMTANLNIDYRNPIPLGSTVLVDSRVEKVDGRKVYSSCQIRSHDNAVLHNEATALFIKLKV